MSEWTATPLSSNVAGFCYDDQGNETLTVEFKSGIRYNYYDIPQQVYEDMKKNADGGASVGKYLHANIKGVYRYARQ